MDTGRLFRIGTRTIWILGILVWSLLTFVTAAFAIESGSAALYACSAAFTALGALVLYRSTRPPGPLWNRTGEFLLTAYGALTLIYWLGKLVHYLRHLIH